ncbi:hypothetical protein LOK49_LG06G00129 [Camellia lanceoleosa]|uniref:Uncharacterized protein n=1 Tax=Camellia lanceoleosa TaxID=1840588 RepID=A0ACC0HGD4_9ERIC|nr:hypothetical protein LOK49_LG06G00129 [Camellia lanceoleosa]
MSSAASYGCIYFDRRCFRKDDVKSFKGRKLYVCNSVASTPQGLQFANTKVQIPEKTVRIGVLGASGYTDLIAVKDANFSNVDAVFCCLPHGTTQEIIKALPKGLKIVDLSANFRL